VRAIDAALSYDPEEDTMSGQLRGRLIGAWKLASYAENPIDGSACRCRKRDRGSCGDLVFVDESSEAVSPHNLACASVTWRASHPVTRAETAY
jgi:hypothetical protein